MHQQFIDLGVECRDIEAYLNDSGFWNTPEKRGRHGYVLSPCAYLVSKEQQTLLCGLAHATYQALGSLDATLKEHARRRLSNEEAAFLKLATRATKGLLAPDHRDEDMRPPIVKVDLVQNPDGRYFIAEVDAYNPRGLGYLALLEGTPGLRGARYPSVGSVMEIIRSCGSEMVVLISEFERYYQSSYGLLQNAAATHGIKLHMIREEELAARPSLIDMLAEVPFLAIPESLHTHPKVRECIMQKYAAGEIKTLYPPAAYLGSKAFLPFLSRQARMDNFVPCTALVSKKNPGLSPTEGDHWGFASVLKAAMSSGMKGVLFSDIHEKEYNDALARARSTKHPAWIMQAQIAQRPYSVVVFDERGSRIEAEYYLRVIAHITADGVLDVEITGRPDRLVHGAPDCIQLPSLLA